MFCQAFFFGFFYYFSVFALRWFNSMKLDVVDFLLNLCRTTCLSLIMFRYFMSNQGLFLLPTLYLFAIHSVAMARSISVNFSKYFLLEF